MRPRWTLPHAEVAVVGGRVVDHQRAVEHRRRLDHRPELAQDVLDAGGAAAGVVDGLDPADAVAQAKREPPQAGSARLGIAGEDTAASATVLGRMAAPARDPEPRAAARSAGSRGRDRLFGKDGWPVARCPACGLVYVDADASIARRSIEIYGRDYYEGEVFDDYLGERDARLASGRARAARLAALVPGGRLLDLGCAAGFFLHAASAHYAVTGVEVSAFASQHARDEFGHRVFTGEIFDARSPTASSTS